MIDKKIIQCLNYLCFVLLLSILTTCVPTHNQQTNKSINKVKEPLGFQYPFQIVPKESIKSVSLEGSIPSSLPQLYLSSSSTLHLHFDEITDLPRTFGIRFSRFTKDWESDGFVTTQISNGQVEDLITSSDRSDWDFPTFFQFDYEFPNDRIQFKLSGNWLLEVFDYSNGQIEFSIPFYISEQNGSTEINYETLNESDYTSRYQHQFFLTYNFNNSIIVPEYNLSVLAIQDGIAQFTKELPIKDLSNRFNNRITFQHDRNQLFDANFDHQLLDIRKLKPNKVVRFIEERTSKPVLVELYDDNPSFENSTNSSFINSPSRNRLDRYSEVRFSFVPDWNVEANEQIFVSGLFNQWSLKPEFKLNWSDSLQRYTANALIKQGKYAYSYFVLKDNQILTLKAQNQFAHTERNYTFIVYYKDPNTFTDKILYIAEKTTK